MICYIDMDGVLVDFQRAACTLHGREWIYGEPLHPSFAGVWEMENLLGLSREEFWAPMRDWDWWAHLPITSDGQLILLAAERMFGAANVCILTNAAGCPHASAGKMMWMNFHMPEYAGRLYIISGTSGGRNGKGAMGAGGGVLIDDCDAHVSDFGDAGGYGILVPRAWNSGHADRGMSFRCVKRELERLEMEMLR